MYRREFHRLALSAGISLLPGLGFAAPEKSGLWADIETSTGARLGVAVLDTGTGALTGRRLDERFAMCSAFKWLAAAHVLRRVDQGQETLSRRVPFGREALLPWSPVTEKHADGNGMTLAELCHATVTTSDNAAANLILKTLGGPAGLTAFARQQGDTVTRLDRWEPDLNEALPGDERDTSSPRAMAGLLRELVLGQALSAAGRRQLTEWLQATDTNRKRLAAGLPAGWRVGSKTGTGGQGTTNDVGVYWPPGRPPVVVAVFLTQCKASLATREAAIARVAKAVFKT